MGGVITPPLVCVLKRGRHAEQQMNWQIIQEMDEGEHQHSESDSESDLRPATPPPHLRHRQDEVDMDEEVVPSLRAQDLAGRIRSYQGMLWRKNTKNRARGWTRSWFKVAPGKCLKATDSSIVVRLCSCLK